jgi:hypothetical protein
MVFADASALIAIIAGEAGQPMEAGLLSVCVIGFSVGQ